MRVEEDREIGNYGYWKISFTLFSNSGHLQKAFFTKWAKEPVGYFPFKISSGNKSIKVSFSDKQTKYHKVWNIEKQRDEIEKYRMSQRDIDDYKEWFFQLYEEVMEEKIKR
jgi:hypothetical protein